MSQKKSFYQENNYKKKNFLYKIHKLGNLILAVVYCFNTTVPKNLTQAVTKEGLKVRHHKVIYKLIDDLKFEINKKLPTVTVEEEIGT